jgi:hypothetical protein
MTDKYPHSLGFTDEHKKNMTRAAALLNKDDWTKAVGLGMGLVEKYAESYVKGETNFIFCTPELAACVENNSDFFKALCQEGVIEWLTPLVLTKSATVSND